MQLHIYRRRGESPYWHAQVYVGAKRYRFSCQTDDKSTAREYARQRVEELKARHNRGLVGLPEPVRISEVFSRYEREYAPKLRPSSWCRTQVVLKQARDWFVSGPLHDAEVGHVTPGDVQAFLEHKLSLGVSARTVNLYRANLHRVFRLCMRPWLLIPYNPVSATEVLREERREPLLPTIGQYHELLNVISSHPMLRLFVILAWETGARSGELLQLEWADVDFERRFVTFANDPARGRQTKGRRSRTVPLSEDALNALREHAATFRLLSPRSPYVFKHLNAQTGISGNRLETVYLSFKRAAKKIGLPTLRPHDLRHAFVTRKLAQGVPAQLVMRYVGHADLATTLRYTHLVPEHLWAVVSPAAEAEADTHSVHLNLSKP
jgi:integrase